MSKWHSLLELFQFPIKILFIGTLLLGFGNVVLNQNVAFLWQIEEPILLNIAELLRYIGASIIYFFPFLSFVHILSHKYESSVIVIIGVLSYVLIHISMVFYLNPSLPSYYYHSLFGMTSIDFNQISGTLSSIRLPYNLGILGFLLAYGITHFCYIRSRKYSIFGIFSFIDHDSMAAIFTTVISILCGIVIAFVWPFVIQGLSGFFDIIANDISNPINLLLYGMYERLSAVMGLIDIPRQIFWFTDMGGSWLNNVGQKFSGDVAIWTTQSLEGMSSLTTGTFITPYYVINLFIIPAYYFAIYKLCSDKYDRKRYFGFMFIAFILSIVCGNPLPAELLMLILSPMLYIVYIVIVGLLYAFLQMFHVVVGYNFSELLILANPGSGLDLLQYLRNPFVATDVYTLLGIGVVIAIVFYLLTILYFKKYALGMFQVVDKEEVCETIIKNLGGLDNIIDIQSTPDKLNVKFIQRELIDYEALKEHGAYMLLESKNGYLIRIGNISTIVREYILKKKKESMKENEVVS